MVKNVAKKDIIISFANLRAYFSTEQFSCPKTPSFKNFKTRVEAWRQIFVSNVVNFGEMRWKNFTSCFLHLFVVNAVNRGELFIFTTFSAFPKKSFFTRVWTITLNCHVLFLWFWIRFSKHWKANTVNFL